MFRPGGGIASGPTASGGVYRVEVNPPSNEASTATLRIDRFQIVGFETTVILELDDVPRRVPGAEIRVLRAEERPDGLPGVFEELPEAAASCTISSLLPPLVRGEEEDFEGGTKLGVPPLELRVGAPRRPV